MADLDFMLDKEEVDKHASALVAPLNIQKSPKKRSRSRDSGLQRTSSRGSLSITSQSQSQPSPPPTPRSSQDSLPQDAPMPAVFHNYLRAFYHFHPESTVSSSTEESSITVPINQGDVILVHSVHPNGWADGTLLATGARGWLPTNYCEAFDHPTIRNLLNALTHLWDLVRAGENGDLFLFTKQDYVRGMIAGVRFFLERTQCLTRDSALIVAHVGLRRMRKGLLGDLSSLVKTAKKLQDILNTPAHAPPSVFEQLDQLVLKSFKLVTRAVRFLDIWSQDGVSISFELNDASNNRPLTPPCDSVDPSTQPPATPNQNNDQVPSTNDAPSNVAQTGSAVGPEETDSATSQPSRSLNRLSVAFSLPSDSGSLQSPLVPSQPQFSSKRLSVSHRLSYTGKSQGGRKLNLASERLTAAHDAFLGFIGSFIGLHLQSRSSDELILTTQQSVSACRQLLAVIDEIWDRDSRRSESLSEARTIMHTRLTELVQATKDMFHAPEAGPADEVVMPESGTQLVSAATDCVRAAGDCVTKARFVIETIGDFEFEHVGLGLTDAVFEELDGPATVEQEQSSEPEPEVDPAIVVASPENKPLPPPPTTSRQPPPPLIISESKPLPAVPDFEPVESNRLSLQHSQSTIVESPVAASFVSSRSSLPPLHQVPTPLMPQPSPSEITQSPASATQRFFGKSPRSDSVNASVADTSSTYRYSMRGDAASVISQASTRATTPDQSPAKMQSSQALTSSFGSASLFSSTVSEDVDAVEEHLLETTYAHELIYNKEGQITGGSLPALVEQLTTHESTPDVMFVTAFYLTFRLFTTPVELAQCLIARFDHIGESQAVGVPVRLRVYNVFKGWLESHWLSDSDSPALGIILSFSTGKLGDCLPAAGKRLAELTAKVTEVRAGALVPRLVSSIGRTSTSNTSFAANDSNVPNPIITRGQLNSLKNNKEGKSTCSILDFDPLELARQITIIESRLFCSIQPSELLASEWTKKNGSKAVNVRAMSTLSTDLANLVADTILQQEDAKKRAVVIKQWVKISARCLELHNYDSLMAIICSLNSSMVLRLKRTWELVSAKTKARLEELKTITDVGRNYAILRQRLQNHVAPCIPFVGIYLTDLTFVDVGNGTTRQLPGETGHDGASVINFDKHMKTAKIIGQLQSFQVPYRLAAIPEMQEWMEAQIQRMRSSGEANIQSYYRRSLLLEPREAAQISKVTPPLGDAQGAFPSETRPPLPKEKFDFLSFSFSNSGSMKER